MNSLILNLRTGDVHSGRKEIRNFDTYKSTINRSLKFTSERESRIMSRNWSYFVIRIFACFPSLIVLYSGKLHVLDICEIVKCNNWKEHFFFSHVVWDRSKNQTKTRQYGQQSKIIHLQEIFWRKSVLVKAFIPAVAIKALFNDKKLRKRILFAPLNT